MKLISWNVNGIRAAVRKGFKDFLGQEKADIVCLQETKISDQAKALIDFDFKGYREYWHSAKRPGYSGTAILVRDGLFPRAEVKAGFGIKEFDDEGRVQTIVLPDFYLLNVYFPNSNPELSRLDYKLRFNRSLEKYIAGLSKKKPVVVTGDFNVAHQEIDLARPKENVGNPGFTAEERQWMDGFLASGFIDTFRFLNASKIQYSWWSFRAGARARNVGWRIDYFCASAKLGKRLKRAYILDKVTGSDHAPVGLEI